MRETVRDLDIIATASDPQALVDIFCALPWVVEVAARGGTKATVVSNDGLRYDLRVVPPESYGNLLQHFTGSKDHNVALREDAVRRGFSVSEYSITEVEGGEEHRFATEAEVYAFLGYDWIPPELREDGGELAAARRHELPQLVSLGDLRGDLHTHTDWSDGKDTLGARWSRRRSGAAMPTTRSATTRTGSATAGSQQQAAAIDALNEQVAPFRILKGIEVNIRADGSLDTPDDELATLDWVVASVHASFDKNPTERVLAAMESPYVDCIGHVTGRKIGKRQPSPVDVERVIEGALRDGHVPRDQLAARPARPHRRPRARRARGGPQAGDRLRRPSGVRSRLCRAGRRPGAAGLADEGRRGEHADVEAARAAPEAAAVTRFRDDLDLAADWVAGYLEGARELPVLSRGRARRRPRAAARVAARGARERSPRCWPTSTAC